jgi:hypothetical protein
MHEILSNWLVSHWDYLSKRLQKVARCGRPDIGFAGTADVHWPEFSGQPDQSITVRVDFNVEGEKGEGKTVKPDFARVVMEVAYSQTLESVMDKGVEYLHKSNGDIRAVIVCNLSYPVTQEKNFVAEIDVWIRMPTGDDGEYSGISLAFLISWL